MSIIHIPEGDIKTTGKVKIYPDGSQKIYAASKPVFHESGWENSMEKLPALPRKQKPKEERTEEDIKRASRRAAAKLRDYALCNDFRWFVTLTLDKTKVDRYDPEQIIKKMRVWLDNRVRRHGLKYLLVPELHKDGAIHFHGFFNDCNIGIADSGTYTLPGKKSPKKPRSTKEKEHFIAIGGKLVYNILDWNFGFSTAIELYGNYKAAVSYVVKYVSKAIEKIGGRWYYSGGALNSPKVVYADLDFRELESAGAFTFPVPGFALAVLEVDALAKTGDGISGSCSEIGSDYKKLP